MRCEGDGADVPLCGSLNIRNGVAGARGTVASVAERFSLGFSPHWSSIRNGMGCLRLEGGRALGRLRSLGIEVVQLRGSSAVRRMENVMARISASIPEDLKDALYQAATDDNQAISHIIVEALRAHFARGEVVAPRPAGGGGGGSSGDEGIQRQLETLVNEVRELKEQLGGRMPPKGARFF